MVEEHGVRAASNERDSDAGQRMRRLDVERTGIGEKREMMIVSWEHGHECSRITIQGPDGACMSKPAAATADEPRAFPVEAGYTASSSRFSDKRPCHTQFTHDSRSTHSLAMFGSCIGAIRPGLLVRTMK